MDALFWLMSNTMNNTNLYQVCERHHGGHVIHDLRTSSGECCWNLPSAEIVFESPIVEDTANEYLRLTNPRARSFSRSQIQKVIDILCPDEPELCLAG